MVAPERGTPAYAWWRAGVEDAERLRRAVLTVEQREALTSFESLLRFDAQHRQPPIVSMVTLLRMWLAGRGPWERVRTALRILR